MSVSSAGHSGEVIKYGDVEKEKEIEKRLKDLGLWENKIHQEKVVERMLDEHIDSSDRLSQVIRRARRRRERGTKQDGQADEKRKDRRTEGMKTMDEIRNIVKPTIIRDREGIPLAYHIDVTMGCFTCDVTHRVTGDGHTVVLFGATSSSSNPLVSMSFLSSKSLPSLFSPAISPRSTSPQRSAMSNRVDAQHLGSTLRYRKFNEGKGQDTGDDKRQDTGDDKRQDTGDDKGQDVKRLTKEISVELPRTVDVSQLIVDYRRGVFKIRVPFILDSTNKPLPRPPSTHATSPSRSSKHSPHPPVLDPINLKTSKLNSLSSPSSPSLPTRSSSKPLPGSPCISPSVLSPTSSNSRAFHCSLTPAHKTAPNGEQISSHNDTKRVADQSEQKENVFIRASPDTTPHPDGSIHSHSAGLLSIAPRRIDSDPEPLPDKNDSSNPLIKGESHVDSKSLGNSNPSSNQTFANSKHFKTRDVTRGGSQSQGERHSQARHKDRDDDRTGSSHTSGGNSMMRRSSTGDHKESATVEESRDEDLNSKAINSCSPDDSPPDVRPALDRAPEFNNLTSTEDDDKPTLDDLVLINYAWSRDEDLDSILKSLKRRKRSRTEEISSSTSSRCVVEPNTGEAQGAPRKTRSESLSGFESKNSLSILRVGDEAGCSTNSPNHVTTSSTNFSSILDFLEESNV